MELNYFKGMMWGERGSWGCQTGCRQFTETISRIAVPGHFAEPSPQLSAGGQGLVMALTQRESHE